MTSATSTLCFAVNRAHAKQLQAKFEEAGVPTGYIDAYTPPDERERVRQQFADGRLRVVCNVGCLTTGVDWDVRCIVLARPTKSEILFVQIIGRGLRTAEGKDDCLILDHSDTHLRLGFVTDIHHEELDNGRERHKAKPRTRPLPKECPQCAFLKPPRVTTCPACGFKPIAQSKIECADGELHELKRSQRRAAEMTRDEKVLFFGQLKFCARQYGYKPGWAACKYRENTGEWPKGLKDAPEIEPEPATFSWIRSRQIAWAKSRGGGMPSTN